MIQTVPQAVVAGTNGDIYVTDDYNFRVRHLDGSGATTLAGDGTGGDADADAPLSTTASACST